MIIVVDAYNLLHAIPPYKKTITDQERNRFISDLNKYGKVKGHKMVIVFDGGPYDWPFKETRAGLLVVHSGTRESADDYIKEYIDKHRSQDMLLVSSDRELNQHAAHLSIPSIDSIAFYQLLKQAVKNQKSKVTNYQETIKITTRKQDDLDTIMMQASQIVPEKIDDLLTHAVQRTSKDRQESKAERALLQKLKKL